MISPPPSGPRTVGTFKNAATNYYQEVTQTLPLAENAAQVFMGMRIQCAQCHNHPFDRWTLDDYYGFSAFFAGSLQTPLTVMTGSLGLTLASAGALESTSAFPSAAG